MTTPPPARPGNLALALFTGVLIVGQAALAAIGLLVWNAHRRGSLTGPEAATFTLLGVSAAAGAVLSLLALIALTRGVRGHGLARLASGLAWLRIAGVIIALVAIAVTLGRPAFAGGFEAFGAVIVVLDAFMMLIVTGVAARRTRHG